MRHDPTLGESRVGCPHPTRRFTRVICLDESALRCRAPGRRLKDAELAAAFHGLCPVGDSEFAIETTLMGFHGVERNV